MSIHPAERRAIILAIQRWMGMSTEGGDCVSPPLAYLMLTGLNSYLAGFGFLDFGQGKAQHTFG